MAKRAESFRANRARFPCTLDGMVRAGMHEAKSSLSRLVQQALDGEDVVITRNGKPAVRLVPVENQPESLAGVLGLWRGKVRMADDFDELTPEIEEMFGIE